MMDFINLAQFIAELIAICVFLIAGSRLRRAEKSLIRREQEVVRREEELSAIENQLPIYERVPIRSVPQEILDSFDIVDPDCTHFFLKKYICREVAIYSKNEQLLAESEFVITRSVLDNMAGVILIGGQYEDDENVEFVNKMLEFLDSPPSIIPQGRDVHEFQEIIDCLAEHGRMPKPLASVYVMSNKNGKRVAILEPTGNPIKTRQNGHVLPIIFNGVRGKMEFTPANSNESDTFWYNYRAGFKSDKEYIYPLSLNRPILTSEQEAS